MRTETKVGVVVGLAMVVAASVYFARTRHDERDLIMSLAPPQAGSTPIIPPDSTARAPTRAEKKTSPVDSPFPALTAASPTIKVPPPTGGLVRSPTAPPSLVAQPGAGLLARQAHQNQPAQTPSTGPGVSPSASVKINPPAPSASPARANGLPAQPRLARTEGMGPKRDAIGSPSAAGASKTVGPPESMTNGSVVRSVGSTPPRSGASAQQLSPSPQQRVALGASEKPLAPGRPNAFLPATPLASASTPPAWPKNHTVQEGDTLAAIARDVYGDSSRASFIIAANPVVTDPRRLRIGMKLVLPAPDTSAGDAAKGSATPLLAKAPSAAGATGSPEVSKSVTPGSDPSAVAHAPRAYVVRPGDSFYSIAEEQLGNAKRWNELFRLNRARVRGDPGRLQPGMTLTLPSASIPEAAQRTQHRKSR